MIFPSLTLETVLQVDDKTRLNGQLSFVNQGEVISDILIQPEASEAFISVMNTDKRKWYLDWAYSTDGIKTVIIKIVTDVTPLGRTRSYNTNILTVDEDSLFSSDNDLVKFENDIFNYLPKGRNSFISAHRTAQDQIIAYLDEQRIWHADGSRITKQDIAAITDDEVREQFNQWSTYQTLMNILESNKVSNDDIFESKRSYYEDMRNSARKRSSLRLDLNKDGALDSVAYDVRTITMKRR